MIKNLTLVAALGLFVGAGYWHGLWTDRWAPSYDAAAAVARFERIPPSVGPSKEWEGSEVSLRPSDYNWTDQGGFLRRYTHRETGDSVIVAIWHGPIGHIGVHTPMTCYPRLGYAGPARPEKHVLQGSASDGRAEFAVAQFSKTTAGLPSHLRFWWAWSGRGDWLAPESPRLTFSSHRALYKMYVMQDLVSGDPNPQPDPCQAFLEAFLPSLNQALFADPM
jgi:hypothetical protein